MFSGMIQKTIDTLGLNEGAVCEIGNQTYIKNGERVSSEVFYKDRGFGRYVSLDVCDRWGSIITDLNEVYTDHEGEFALVTNNGSGEHIFNIAAWMETVHRLCKTGGTMVHCLPFQGDINHGFFSFHPVLFRDLAYANNYDFKLIAISDSSGNIKGDDPRNDTLFHHPKPFQETVTPIELAVRSFGERAFLFTVAAMVKTSDDRFRMPLQGKYFADLATDTLRDEYGR